SMWALTWWLSRDSWLLSSRRDALMARVSCRRRRAVAGPLVGIFYASVPAALDQWLTSGSRGLHTRERCASRGSRRSGASVRAAISRPEYRLVAPHALV